jgi:hypothetical protein
MSLKKQMAHEPGYEDMLISSRLKKIGDVTTRNRWASQENSERSATAKGGYAQTWHSASAPCPSDFKNLHPSE